MDPDSKAYFDDLGVSRETLDRLDAYERLIRKWNPAINLVAPKSLDDLWRRHFTDAAQLHPLAATDVNCADIGSGGGFPGLIVAILSQELAPERTFTLIESDQRKCVFMATVARELDVTVEIKSERIESTSVKGFDIVSARALAPLTKLLDYAAPLLNPGGQALFLKGANAEAELTEARRRWKMEAEIIASVTDPAASVLRIKEFQLVDAPDPSR